MNTRPIITSKNPITGMMPSFNVIPIGKVLI